MFICFLFSSIFVGRLGFLKHINFEPKIDHLPDKIIFSYLVH